MTWTNRVVWQEGMFLRAQHFQQQERWLDMLSLARTAPLRPYSWGMAELAVDRGLLATGRFALSEASGIFEDGTPFAIPDQTDHPPPLELPAGTRDTVVYLAVPIRQPGAPEFDAGSEAEGRYAVSEFEAQDTHSSSPQPASLQIGRLRLRYLLESDERSGHLCIGVARIAAAAPNRRVTLDDSWISPALLCSAVAPLASLLSELTGLLDRRGETLAARVAAGGVGGTGDLAWLQAINRWHPLFAHWAGAAQVHPEEVYRACAQMAGEFATFIEATRRLKPYPAYRHDDLRQSFAPIVADLRGWLQAPEHSATAIPLQERRYGVRVGQIADRSVLQAENFILVVRTGLPTEALQRLFRNQVKIGAVEHIREVVGGTVPGISLRSLQAPPSQVTGSAGAAYFELERNSPHWQQMQSSNGFAIHVAGEFPNLSMELWAVHG
jgi:type VI secretion system protein ImpJ